MKRRLWLFTCVLVLSAQPIKAQERTYWDTEPYSKQGTIYTQDPQPTPVPTRAPWYRFWENLRPKRIAPTPSPASTDVDCQQLNVETTDYEAAPATISFNIDAVNGAQNNVVTEYRIDYGDGASDTNQTGEFTHTYTHNGNYTVQGYVRDQDGAWDGGTFCQRKINLMNSGVTNREPGWASEEPVVSKGGVDEMETQPDTGPASFLLIGSGMATLAGISLRALKKP